MAQQDASLAPARQERVLRRLFEVVADSIDLAGALLIGSLAAGTADAVSDIDVVVVGFEGRFADAWAQRTALDPLPPIVAWDHRRPDQNDVGVHKWLSQEFVLVECVIASPGSEFALAPPHQAIAGPPSLAEAFPPRAPVQRNEMSAAGLHPVELAYDELKLAIRRASRE